jgi:hypothetical protein
MPRRSARPLVTALALATLVSSLAACTTFSAARPADIPLGDSFHLKYGLGRPRDPAVTWWGSGLDDCGLCEGRSIMQTELGWQHGWRGPGARKYSAGLFLDGLAPQLDLYAQLGESPSTNWGIGVRGGSPRPKHGTAKIYLLHDRRTSADTRLLLAPGLFWYGNLHDPDRREHGSSPAWMAAVTQAVGFEIEAERVIFTPQLTLVGVHGELGGDAAPYPDRRLIFDDVFVTVSLGVAFRGKRQ